jgi:hypothetical protein
MPDIMTDEQSSFSRIFRAISVSGFALEAGGVIWLTWRESCRIFYP